VLTAAYALIWMQRACFGPVTSDRVNSVSDLGPMEAGLAFAVAGAILVIGIVPSLILDPAQPSVALLVERLADAAEILVLRP
jgi:NADH:ubiquinone oxidoreductase subunit 4 (subunit M)